MIIVLVQNENFWKCSFEREDFGTNEARFSCSQLEKGTFEIVFRIEL